MATNKPFSQKDTKKNNTKWVDNAMKSIGQATKATFKEFAPTIVDTASSLGDSAKKVSAVIRGGNGTSKKLADNEYIKVAKKTINYAIDDLKKGNLYNPDRGTEAAMKSYGMDFDWESDFDFSDAEGDGDVTFNYVDESDDVSPQATFQITEAIGKGAQSNLQASQAMVDAMVSIAGTSLMHSQQIGNEVIGHLSNIENTLTSLLEYQQENTTNFYEASLAYMEKVGGATDEDWDPPEKRLKGGDLVKSKGGLDMGKYKQYIKQQFKDYTGPASSMLEMLNPQMLEMIASDPVGSGAKMMIRAITPTLVKGTIENVEDAFKDFMPTMLARLNLWKKSSENGFIGNLKRAVGSIFGIDIDHTNSFDLGGRVTKDAAVFDGVTRNSVVEVIPKYLRESTAYLKAIAEHLKIDTNAVVKNSDVYDIESNSYIKQGAVRRNIASRLNNAATSQVAFSKSGKAISSLGSALEGKDSDNFNALTDELFSLIGRSDTTVSPAEIDFTDPDNIFARVINKAKKGDKSSKKVAEILKKGILSLKDENKLSDLASAQMSARSEFGRLVDQMSEDFDIENILASGLDNDTDLSNFIQEEIYSNQDAVPEYLADAKRKRKKDIKKSKKQDKKQQKEEDTEDSEYKRKSAATLLQEAREFLGTTPKEKRNAEIQNAEANGVLTSFANAGNHLTNSMYAMINGDSKQATAEFAQIFGDSMKGLWNSFKGSFIDPVTKALFGEKDKDGFKRDGIFAGAQNKIKDSWHELNLRITGKAYKDSEGNLHSEEKDGFQSASTIVKNTMSSIGESIRYKLFGDPDDKEDKDGKKKGGIVQSVVSSMKEGVQGWKVALFGEDEGDADKSVKQLKEYAKKSIPDAGAGAVLGGAAGMMAGSSLLGTLIGGPVGGAVLGLGIGFAKRSNKFQDYVFGPEVEEADGSKHRVGGLVSRATQEMFKDPKLKKSVIGGAALGAAKGILTGGGLLGGIVGGPIAGAMIGAGAGFLVKSQMFQDFLYGNEEKGKTGLIQHVKNAFNIKKVNGGDTSDDKSRKNILKSLGMGAIGAAGAGISASLIGQVGLLGAMATPAGPLGAAIVGGAVGIAASSKRFAEKLFGKKDEKTGKREGGLTQKMLNFMHVEVMAPMKSFFLEVGKDLKTTVKYEVLDVVRITAEPLLKGMSDVINNIKEKATSTVKNVGSSIDKNFIKPILSIVSDVLSPVRKAAGIAAKAVIHTATSIAKMPFKIMLSITKTITSPFVKAAKLLGKAFVSPLVKAVKGITGVATKGIGLVTNSIAAVTKVGSQFIGDKLARVGKNLDKRDYEDDGTFRSENIRRKREYRDERRRNKQEARERTNLDNNRREMAKILGYDVKYFTEENYQKALAAAKAQKKKVHFTPKKNMTFEEDPAVVAAQERAKIASMSDAELINSDGKTDDIDVRALQESAKQTHLLDRIAQWLTGKSPLGNKSSIGEVNESGESKSTVKATVETPSQSGPEESSADTDAQVADYERWAQEIGEAGGFKNFIKDKFADKSSKVKEVINNTKEDAKADFAGIRNLFGRKRRVADVDELLSMDEDAFMRYTFGDNYDQSGDQPKRSRKLKDFFGRKGRARAKGGDVEKGKSYLVGDGGKDPSAMEIITPKTPGKVLSQNKDGIKVSIENISKTAQNKLTDSVDDSSIKFNLDSADNLKGLFNEYKIGTASDATIDTERDENKKKGSYASQKEAKDKLTKEEEQRATLQEIAANTKDTAETSRKSLWNWLKIFGKAGLLTAGLVAFWPVIKKVFGIFKDSGIDQFKQLLGDLKFGLGSLTDGMNSFQVIGKGVQDIVDVLRGKKKAKDLALGDDGLTDATTGGKVNFIAQKAAKVGKRAIKFGKVVKSFAKSGVKAFAKESGEEAAETGVKKATIKSVTKRATKEGAEEGAEQTVKLSIKRSTKNAAKEAAEAGTKSLKQKTIDLFKKAINFIVDKIGGKLGKKAGGEAGAASMKKSVKTLVTKVVKVIETKFPRISAKMSALFASDGALAAATAGVGWLLKNATFATLEGINAASNPRNLFRLSSSTKPDFIMTAIATGIGAVKGTTPGACLDIINSLVISILGIDLFSEFASLCYRSVCKTLGYDDKIKNMENSQAQLKTEYNNYRETSNKKEYKSYLLAHGLDSKKYSYSDYQKDIESGKVKESKHLSFSDYNYKQNKTIGSKIADATLTLGKNIGKLGANIWGKNKIGYYDENTKIFYIASDTKGKYKMYQTNGLDKNGQPSGNLKYVGDISEANMPDKKSLKKITIEKKGLKSVVNLAKEKFLEKGRSVGKGFSTIGSGLSDITKGHFLKGAAKTAVGSAKVAFEMTPGSTLIKAMTKGAGNVLLKNEKEIFRDPSTGGYWNVKGQFYNATGDRIEFKDVTTKELQDMYTQGLVKKDQLSNTAALKNVAKKTVFNTVDWLQKSFTKIGKGLTSLGKSVGSWTSNAVKKVTVLGKKFGTGLVNGIGKFFVDGRNNGKTGYYTPDGKGYYVLNEDGKSYSKYSMANDLLVAEITGNEFDEITECIERGIYKASTIENKSTVHTWVDTAKKSFSNIQKSIASGIKGAYSKVKSWLTGSGDVSLPDKTTGSGGYGIGGKGGDDNYPYYSQKDSRWANSSYSQGDNKGTMGESGCGPTAMAMVASKYSGKKMDPMQVAKDAKTSGYRDETGTNAGFMNYESDKLNLSHKEKSAPTAEYISKNVGNGKSMILNGVSVGGDGPFTSAGHYVVATGKDANGNIKINDPRGKEYSGSISPDALARDSRIGWTFKKSNKSGGFGNYVRHLGGFGKKSSGSGKDWIGCVRSVHKAMSALGRAKGYQYDQSAYHTIKVDGSEYKVRWDCSGYVSCCLQVYGVKSKGWVTNSTGFASSSCNIDKFKYMSWPGWDNLQEGDIIARSGHVEIFAYNKNGQHYVYNAGSTNAINATSPTGTGHPQGYTGVWRPNDPGQGVELATDSTSNDATVSSDSSSSSDETDALSRITDLTNQFSTKAMNGILTGKWDYNFDTSTSSSSDSSSSSSTDSSNDNIDASKIKGSKVAEKAFNYFRKLGYSDAAIAGILGNAQQESGLNPAAGKGKGPAYGIWQWESGRFANLQKAAKKAGTNWDNADIQIKHLASELSNPAVAYFGKSATYGSNIGHGAAGKTNWEVAGTSQVSFDEFKKSKDPGTAARQFEAAVERASWPRMENRVSYAKGFMDKYGGKGEGDDENLPVVHSNLLRTTERPTEYNEIHQNEIKRSIGGNGSSEKVEKLLSDVYDILVSINGNAEGTRTAISNLKTGDNITNQNTIITTGDKGKQQTQTSTKVAKKTKAQKMTTSKATKNANLAERIAKG